MKKTWSKKSRDTVPLRSPRIDSQPGGPVRQPYLSYRPDRLHRLAKSIPRNRFLGSINVYKYGLCFVYVHNVDVVWWNEVLCARFWSSFKTTWFGNQEIWPWWFCDFNGLFLTFENPRISCDLPKKIHCFVNLNQNYENSPFRTRYFADLDQNMAKTVHNWPVNLFWSGYDSPGFTTCYTIICRWLHGGIAIKAIDCECGSRIAQCTVHPQPHLVMTSLTTNKEGPRVSKHSSGFLCCLILMANGLS